MLTGVSCCTSVYEIISSSPVLFQLYTKKEEEGKKKAWIVPLSFRKVKISYQNGFQGNNYCKLRPE